MLANVVVGTLVVATAILWRQMTERTFRVDPWEVDGGTVTLREPLSWCIGTRSDCVFRGGVASVWAPVTVNGTWRFDASPSGSLRVSVNGLAVLHVTTAGGIVSVHTCVYWYNCF